MYIYIAQNGISYIYVCILKHLGKLCDVFCASCVMCLLSETTLEIKKHTNHDIANEISSRIEATNFL